MNFAVRHSCHKASSFLRAIGTLVAASLCFAGIFAITAAVHGQMTCGLRGAIRDGAMLGLIGLAAGMVVGGGIVVAAHSTATITLRTLGCILVAGLAVGLIASAAGAVASVWIADATFSAFPPVILGLSGTIVGICGAAIYVAEEATVLEEEQNMHATTPVTRRAGRFILHQPEMATTGT
jgi:hypothetical protein